MNEEPLHRNERVVTVVVVGLSLVIGCFFLWTTLGSPRSTGTGSPGEAVAFTLVNVAAGGLLWWHRRYPVRVFAGVLAIYLVSAAATQLVLSGALTLPLWFAVFAVAAYAPLRPAVAAIVAGWVADTIVTVVLTVTAGYPLTVLDIVAAFIGDVGFFYIACLVLGLGFRSQYQRAREATEHARLVEENSRALHAEAVATERNRLARDLHDLAAHELMDALLAVRALQVSNGDPALPEIEAKTSRALENMRVVVRTLREDDHRDDLERLPLAEAATQLLDVLREERDLRIEARIDPGAAVDDGVAPTVLGVLKETVLNAARHAPGMPVTVALHSSGSDVRLTVSNPTCPSSEPRREGTGYGLIGAEERARLLGGDFGAGMSASGEWVARLRLRASAPAAETELTGEVR